MNRNNTWEALVILQKAMHELNKLNYDTSAFWATEVEEAKEHVQYAIDRIDDDLHASNSLIHQENQ
jgi:hypothetical protein